MYCLDVLQLFVQLTKMGAVQLFEMGAAQFSEI